MGAPPTATAADKAVLIAGACKDAKATSTGWQACCPAHEDTHPSLSISVAGDKVLLHCHAGCSVEAICASLMLTVADLFCGEKKGKLPIVATYDYVDAAGTLRFQVVRLINKSFPQRQPAPGTKSGWRWDLKGVTRVLYRLPALLDGLAAGDPVYIAEGEKDIDNLRSLGLTATCNPGGAGNWVPAYSDTLRGAHVVLLPDHDVAGAQHAQKVARMLYGLAASIKIVPGIHTEQDGSDVTDWLNAGGTREALEAAVARCPTWTAPPAVSFAATAPGTTNGSHTPTPGALPSYPDPDDLYTDTFNARALVKAHGTTLRYCYAWKSWMVWSGKVWQRDTSGLVPRLAKQTIKAMARLLSSMDDKSAIALLGHIKSSLSTVRLKAMVESAQNEEGIPVDPDAFDTHPWLLNCANGTLDLRTHTLLPHTKEHLLTQYIPVQYDPGAHSPLWDTFLRRILADNDELIAFLQRAIGYALTGVIREHVLLILWGSGRNGKSTLLMTILRLLGPYGLKAVAELLMASTYDRHLTERADLFKKRLVIVSETEQGRRLAESFTKDATGGENIRARRMHENTWEFEPTHKLVMATNHKPVIRGTDTAIWERMKLVPFTVTIPIEERDPWLLEKLSVELPGILTWAVKGCQQWQHYGLGEPEEVTAATAEYKEEMDTLGQFITDCCLVSPRCSVKTSELYKAYEYWCSQQNEEPMKQRTWGIAMTERGFERDHGTGNAHIRRGIGLLSHAAPAQKA